MVLLEVPFIAVIFFWARWLSRRYGAPRWIRAIGPIAVVFWLVPNLITIYVLRSAITNGGLQGDQSAEKARVLAETISNAFYFGAISILALILTGLLLFILTWRYHWSTNDPPAPPTQPYR